MKWPNPGAPGFGWERGSASVARPQCRFLRVYVIVTPPSATRIWPVMKLAGLLLIASDQYFATTAVGVFPKLKRKFRPTSTAWTFCLIFHVSLKLPSAVNGIVFVPNPM